MWDQADITLEAKISSFVGVKGLYVKFERDLNICKTLRKASGAIRNARKGLLRTCG